MQMSLFIDGITDSLFDGFIDRREKSSMEWHTVFLLVIYYIQQWKYQQHKAGEVFFDALCPSVNPSVKLLLTDSPTRVLPIDYFHS
jgi:hypothetical protein